MNLMIEGHEGPIEDPELLAAAELLVADHLLEEDDDEEEVAADELDPLAGELGEHELAKLATWSAWRAQLAVEVAEACGCAVYADDDPTRLVLVGLAEDAEACKRTYRRVERVLMRRSLRECAGKAEAWRERWLAGRIETMADEIEGISDLCLERAWRCHDGGTSVVFEPEHDVEVRAERARAWIAAHLAVDQLAVVPDAPPQGVVDMAAFAARAGR